MKVDRTLTEASAYASDAWIAQTLGKPVTWFKENRAALEREGFPRKDRLLDLTQKADIHAWLARRRTVADAGIAQSGQHHDTTTPSGARLDAF